MKWVTLVSEDRVGLLADISYVLSKSNMPIQDLHVDVVGGRAVISMEVKDPHQASDVLVRNGFKTMITDSLIIKVNGGPEKVRTLLKGEHIAVREMCELTSDSQAGVFALKVDKPRRAVRVLNAFIFGNLPEEAFC